MQVIRSDLLGFCMGVSRAFKMALEASASGQKGNKGSQVYTLGPLIHNPRVIKDLSNRGVKILKEGEIPPANSTVIIRAHGISPQLEASLKRDNIRILDATCPHVKANQKIACDYAKRAYWVFLAGEENHSEIIGIRAYAGESSCSVAANPLEAEAAALSLLNKDKDARTVLIGQTTISPGEYHAIGEAIKKYFPALEVLDTICGATMGRQKALKELCAGSDAVIIAGGRDSANTRRLLSLALELGKPAWIAESVDDIPDEAALYDVIGLSAGASTPDSLIDEIEEELLKKFP